jgi:membrane protein required for colicin V production
MMKDAYRREPMNAFDVVVVAVAVVVIVMGFSAGLLRSLATILGYLIAAPLAVAIAPGLTTLILGQHIMPSDPLSPGQLPSNQTWLVLCVTFIAAGILISALLRAAVGEFAGHDVGLFDRLAGAALGAVRIGLIAVLIAVIFDRVIPADREPQFLANSQLRPYLSAAGQKGLRSLPPEIDDYIDQLRRQRGI